MLTQAERDAARKRAAAVLAEAGIALTAPELDAIEVADFGLSRLDETGLEVVVYVNTERVCAKELGYGGAADVAIRADVPPAAGHRRRQRPHRAREPADPGLRAWRPQHVVARRGLATSARGDRR